MKRLVLLTLLIPFLFASCNKETEVEPVLTVSQSSIDAPAEGSSTTIKLLCNNKWTVSAPDWCTVSPSGGEGNEKEVQVTVTVKENAAYDGRSGSITFKSGDLTATLNVKQEADTGVVLPKNEYNISSDAQQLEVTVQANVQYSVEIDVDWITLAESKALETETLLFDVMSNEGYDPRTGIISIINESTDETMTITVNQVAADAILVSPAECFISCEEQNIELEVQTNVDIEILIPDEAKDWVSHVETKALEEKKVVLKIAANTGYEPRYCEVQVGKKDSDYAETIFITQEAMSGIIIPKKEFDLSSEKQTLEIALQASSPVQYEVAAEGKEWISIVETKALEDYVLTIAIEENSGYEPRKSEVYVRLERSNDHETISIVQQAKDTLYVEEKLYNVVKNGGTIEVKVKSTVDYDVEIKDSWISSADTKALAESTRSFVVAANSEVQGRNGYIVFKSKTTEHKDTVTVNQSGAGGYRWYNGIEASTFVPGSGTENDPYIIHTANDLQWLIDQANYGDEDIHEQNDYDDEKTFKTMGKHYRLTHDIEIDSDYDVVDGSGNVIQAKGWTPIGMGLGDSYRYQVFKAFNGHFDGGGHTISGKMVPVSQLTEEGNLYFGLFGHCWMPKGDGNVTIKNLNMTAVVDAQHALSPTNSAYIGSIVGFGQELEIDSCTNSGNVTGGDFTVDYMQYLYLGGLVGYFQGKGEALISNCENKGEIRGGKVSPLLGQSHVGGLVGYGNHINAKGLTNRGKVYGAGYETAFTGGIFGYCEVQKSASELNNHSQVYGPEINVLEYNNYGTSNVGGIAGEIYGRADTKLTDVNNHADITGGIFTGNYFDKNKLYIGGIGGVCSIEEVRNASNYGKILACSEYDTIIKEASVGGLFGYLTSGVADSTNEGEVHIDFKRGTIFVGGFAGEASSGAKTISNCTNNADIYYNQNISDFTHSGLPAYLTTRIAGFIGGCGVRLSDCVNNGDVNCGFAHFCEAGGIAGFATGKSDYVGSEYVVFPAITNCINEGNVNVTSKDGSSLYVGGIVGNQGSSNLYIKDCHNKARVSSGECSRYNYTGGILGLALNSNLIDSCKNSGDIHSDGVSYVGAYSFTAGIVGYLDFRSIVFNSCENSGNVSQKKNGETDYIGSIAGFVYLEEYTPADQPAVCSCSKDTSGSGLPLVGGGYTTLVTYADCTGTH